MPTPYCQWVAWRGKLPDHWPSRIGGISEVPPNTCPAGPLPTMTDLVRAVIITTPSPSADCSISSPVCVPTTTRGLIRRCPMPREP